MTAPVSSALVSIKASGIRGNPRIAIRRVEDPAIAADANALQERFTELAAAQAEVDRLYARWGELEAKVSS